MKISIAIVVMCISTWLMYWFLGYCLHLVDKDRKNIKVFKFISKGLTLNKSQNFQELIFPFTTHRRLSKPEKIIIDTTL